jgi:hypothetical protein
MSSDDVQICEKYIFWWEEKRIIFFLWEEKRTEHFFVRREREDFFVEKRRWEDFFGWEEFFKAKIAWWRKTRNTQQSFMYIYIIICNIISKCPYSH